MCCKIICKNLTLPQWVCITAASEMNLSSETFRSKCYSRASPSSILFLNLSSMQEHILHAQHKHMVLSYFVAMLYHLQKMI